MFDSALCRPVNCPAPCEGGFADLESSRGPSRAHEEESTELRDAQPVKDSSASPGKGPIQDGLESSPRTRGNQRMAAFSHITREAIEAGRKASSSKQSSQPKSAKHEAQQARPSRPRRSPTIIYIQPPYPGAKGANAIAVLKGLVQDALEKQAEEEKQTQSQSQRPRGNEVEDQEQWKPPAWQMEEAFSQDLGKVVVKVFKDALNLQDADEATALRHLGKLEPGERNRLVKEVLLTGDCTSKLAVELGRSLGGIAQAEALTGDEMNAKFAMCPDDKFEMVFGDKATYLKGLEPRIGLPSAKTLQAIVEEHCWAEDSTVPWTTGNYGITTTSREELLIVLKTIFEEFQALKQRLQQREQQLQHQQEQQQEQMQQQPQQQQQQLQQQEHHLQQHQLQHQTPQPPPSAKRSGQDQDYEDEDDGEEDRIMICTEEELWKPIEASIQELQSLVKEFDLTDIEWKAETKNDDLPRAANRSKNMLLSVMKKNRQLKALEGNHPMLRLEEVLLCNLYTGPLFEKYNQVHRGGSLTGDNNPYMERRFRELCRGNRYTTSQFVLTSGMIKLSVLSKAMDLYRGVGKGLLPQQFWRPNLSGSRGGVELGFMSATTDRSVACQYASGSAIQTVFEMSTGMIDNGAELDWISQYPHEKEICFPPLTALEVVKTRCEGSQLCISLRLNLNLTNDTIEKVVGKRKEVIHSLCHGLQQEVKQFLSGPSSLWKNTLRDVSPEVSAEELIQIKETALEGCKKKLLALQEHQPEFYNSDGAFLQVVQQSLTDASAAKFCGGKVLLEIAEVLDHAEVGAAWTWKERLAPMAMCLLEGDFEAKPVMMPVFISDFTFPSEEEGFDWVINALGFKRWQSLWVEAGPDFRWTDSNGKSRQTVPQSLGRPLPPDCWLMELEGCQDLDQGARKLAAKYKDYGQNNGLLPKFTVDFAIAQPRQQKDLREWWYDFVQRGGKKAAALRLQRIWAMVPPTSFDEEWAFSRLLEENGSQAWAETFREGVADGVISVPKQLRLEHKCMFLFIYCPDFWYALASSDQLQDLTGDLEGSSAKSLGDAAASLSHIGRIPFLKLQTLRLTGFFEEWDPRDLAKCVVAMPRLEVLALVKCRLTSFFAMALGSAIMGEWHCCWPNLRELELSGNPLGRNLYKPNDFAQGLASLASLEALIMEDCSLEASSFAPALFAALAREKATNEGGSCWPKLKNLNFSGNHQLLGKPSDQGAFTEHLLALPSLEALSLNGCGLNSSLAKALASSTLAKKAAAGCCWPKLKELWLDGYQLLGASLQQPSDFVTCLATLSTLEVLALGPCGLGSSFAMALASAILEDERATKDDKSVCWPNLRRLRLTSNPCLGANLTDPSNFAKGLAALPSLQELWLHDCGLDSSFAMAFGSTMLDKDSGCRPKLNNLRLDINPLGTTLQEPCTFAKALAALQDLEIVRLDRCYLDSNFAMALGSALQDGGGSWPKLKEIKLYGNIFGAGAVWKLKQQLAKDCPEAEVLIDSQVGPARKRCSAAFCFWS